MEITPKIRKLIYGMFDDMIEGANKYETKSSTWLIFTDEKKWVLEFTKEKVLWFNYGTFQSELVLVGMDCVDSKDVIKEWFESRFLGIEVENTIQNSVNHTESYPGLLFIEVEDTIQNGVKVISWLHPYANHSNRYMDEIIQTGEGVKAVEDGYWKNALSADEVIKNGVKYTDFSIRLNNNGVEETIQNGVKTMMSGSEWYHKDEVEEIIQNGVKS